MLQAQLIRRSIVNSRRISCRQFTTSIATKSGNEVISTQAVNRKVTWSKSQAKRETQMVGPRFEQTDLEAQPKPLAAIELIYEEPIREVDTRIVSCNGGGGALGHPKVYINLDQGKPVPCGYCGILYQKKDHHH